jgi:hypothetical protein
VNVNADRIIDHFSHQLHKTEIHFTAVLSENSATSSGGGGGGGGGGDDDDDDDDDDNATPQDQTTTMTVVSGTECRSLKLKVGIGGNSTAIEGEVCHGRGHEGPEREQRYCSTLSLTSVLGEGGVVNATPRPFYSWERDLVTILCCHYECEEKHQKGTA